MLKSGQVVKQIAAFYLDGFRAMTLGKTLWAIILIKLLIIYGVLKVFFFPDYLHDNYTSDIERAAHVSSSLTQIPMHE